MREYLALLSRRKFHILIPLLLILGAGIALAYMLPPVYKSEATILVKAAEIPDELIKTTVTGYLQQRIEEIRQRTLTRAGVLEIARQIDYYSGQEGPTPLDDEIVKDMAESIIVEMVDVRANEAGSRGGSVTVAFTVAFEAGDALVAKRGARAITNLFVEENKRMRYESVAGVVEFLADRVANEQANIDEIEGRLTTFKKQHLNELPELNDRVRSSLEATELKAERADEKIRGLEDSIASLSGQLSYIDPYIGATDGAGVPVQTNDARLTTLTAQYASASARYSPEHPEVRKLRRDLEAMVGSTSAAGLKLNQLIGARDDLAQAERKYSAAHPDVRKLRSKVALLESDLGRSVRVQGSATKINAAVEPNNPVYVNLTTQLNRANVNLNSERLKLSRLQTRVESYESRLNTSPLVERDYRAILSELEAHKSTFEDLNEKLVTAKLAGDLEGDNKGERFDIVDPAPLPHKPDRPNRLGIALLSFLLAISAGIGAAAIGEYTDKTIYGSKGLVAAFGAQPIAVIPNIPENGAASANSATARVAQGLATAIVIVLIASAVLFIYQMNKPMAPQSQGAVQKSAQVQ